MRTKLTLLRFFGAIVLICGLASCAIGLWLFLQSDKYQAITRIKIEREVLDSSVNGNAPYDPYFIQTEFEVLQSEVILGKVVESLGLNTEWGKKHAGGKVLKTQESIRIIRSCLELRPVGGTSLIEIQIINESPVEAAKIANAIADAYRSHRLEQGRRLAWRVLKH